MVNIHNRNEKNIVLVYNLHKKYEKFVEKAEVVKENNTC